MIGARAHHATCRLTPASGAHTPSAWATIHGGLWLLHHGWHPIVAIVATAVVTIVVIVVHHGRSTHAWHHTPLQIQDSCGKVGSAIVLFFISFMCLMTQIHIFTSALMTQIHICSCINCTQEGCNVTQESFGLRLHCRHCRTSAK